MAFYVGNGDPNSSLQAYMTSFYPLNQVSHLPLLGIVFGQDISKEFFLQKYKVPLISRVISKI